MNGIGVMGTPSPQIARQSATKWRSRSSACRLRFADEPNAGRGLRWRLKQDAKRMARRVIGDTGRSS
jgi:hypothetical protein